MEKWSTVELPLEHRFDGGATGDVNMRLDAAMLAALEAGGEVAPLLRFYSWRPAAISIGHHQGEAELDLDRARADGYDVVRRPTGGGAVLHANEITYAFAARWPRYAGGRHVRDAYGIVADAFVAALEAAGVPAERGGAGGVHQSLCFARAQAHEIHVGGKKLAGSAMRAGRRGFLVHGSILCGPEHRKLAAYAPQGAGALDARTTDLAELGLDHTEREHLCARIATRLTLAWSRGAVAAE